jgi:hypothetical protein
MARRETRPDRNFINNRPNTSTSVIAYWEPRCPITESRHRDHLTPGLRKVRVLIYCLYETKLPINHPLVFYVIFVDDETVLPNIRASLDEDSDNKDIGCILGARVPPPQTIKSLKKAICKAEQMPDPGAFDLYGTVENDEALDEGQKLLLSSAQYPGFDPADPIVLVNKESSQVDMGTRLAPYGASVANPSERVICGRGF